MILSSDFIFSISSQGLHLILSSPIYLSFSLVPLIMARNSCKSSVILKFQSTAHLSISNFAIFMFFFLTLHLFILVLFFLLNQIICIFLLVTLHKILSTLSQTFTLKITFYVLPFSFVLRK